MGVISYARPRLTTSEDKRYRAYVQQFTLQRKNQRAMRPPRQRDIFGGQAEEALRTWLGGQFILSERRILEYEERRGKRAITKYRELDAVILEHKYSVWVFEIKASRVAHSLRRAVGQLQETRAILRLIYQNVFTTVLLVDTGIPTVEEVVEIMNGPEPPPQPPETLAEAIESLEGVHLISDLSQRSQGTNDVDVLLFRVEDIVALVGAENLALDWSDDDVEEREIIPIEPSHVYSTSDEDEGENTGGALAEALRRAGLGN